MAAKVWDQLLSTTGGPLASCSHLNEPRRTNGLEAKPGSPPNPGTHLL